MDMRYESRARFPDREVCTEKPTSNTRQLLPLLLYDCYKSIAHIDIDVSCSNGYDSVHTRKS